MGINENIMESVQSQNQVNLTGIGNPKCDGSLVSTLEAYAAYCTGLLWPMTDHKAHPNRCACKHVLSPQTSHPFYGGQTLLSMCTTCSSAKEYYTLLNL